MVSTTNVTSSSNSRFSKIADIFLTRTGQAWFIVALFGQWIFALYVAAFYGGSAFTNNLERWTEVIPHGIVEGDPMGNIALSVHLLLAFIIMVLGPLQFIPWIRNNFRKFHRINGRIYVSVGMLTSIAGLVMLWGRGTVGGTIMSYGLSLNAILIIGFGYLVYRNARKGDYTTHMRWAWRFFMVINGVWFFRVMLMFWLVVHQAPVGFDPDTFKGPFLSFLTFGQYLVPLCFLELYFLAKDHSKPLGNMAMAIVTTVAILIIATGIFAASMGMWIPRL